ncbi:MAG: hypothetical protein AB1Z66_11915 [Candidatus Limnocylindrales bacterium]
MRGTSARRARRALASGLCALLATVNLGGNLLAQPPTSSAEPSPSSETEGVHLFPSAEEVSDIFGVDLTLLGIGGGLSQAWEGSDFDSEALSAQMAMYASAREQDEGPRTAVIIDIVVFESADDALMHTKDTLFGDDPIPPGFETESAGDFVVPMSFTHEGAAIAIVFHVTGPVAFSVTALAEDAPEPKAERDAIAQLILDRLVGEPSAAP